MVTANPSSILDCARGDLVLRVCGPSRCGQVVRLKSHKCTVGSGDQCTLRIRARHVRPLHCLILRGSSVTVIRRWAPDTLLNGRGFTDAPLTPGDRIRIGPVELEVLACTPPSSEVNPSFAESGGPPPQAGVALRQDIEKLNRRVDATRRHARTRARRLLAELRAARDEVARLQDRVGSDDRESGSAEHGGASRHARKEAIDQELAQFEQHRLSFRKEREKWEAQAELLESRRADAERELTERLEQFNARANSLRAQEADLEAARRAFEAERTEFERRLAERSGELDAREERLRDVEARFEARRQVEADRSDAARTLSFRRDDEPEVRFEEPDGGAPESSAEIFRRMGIAASSAEEEAPAVPRPGEGDADSCRVTAPIAASAAPDSVRIRSDEEDESIDAYMARLLKRVQKTSGGQPVPAHAAPPGPPKSEPLPSGQSVDSPLPSGEPPGTPTGHAALSPRAVAPEKLVDLASLRDLANFSAQSAIDAHARRTMAKSSIGKSLVMLVSLLAGASLTWVWWARCPDARILYAAGVSFVIAVLWGIHNAMLVRILLRSQPRRQQARSANSEQKGAP